MCVCVSGVRVYIYMYMRAHVYVMYMYTFKTKSIQHIVANDFSLCDLSCTEVSETRKEQRRCKDTELGMVILASESQFEKIPQYHKNTVSNLNA